jgi:hypothetical protein
MEDTRLVRPALGHQEMEVPQEDSRSAHHLKLYLLLQKAYNFTTLNSS